MKIKRRFNSIKIKYQKLRYNEKTQLNLNPFLYQYVNVLRNSCLPDLELSI